MYWTATCGRHVKYIVKCSKTLSVSSRVAQWKRAGPITQRSEDQNLALLTLAQWIFFSSLLVRFFPCCRSLTKILRYVSSCLMDAIFFYIANVSLATFCLLKQFTVKDNLVTWTDLKRTRTFRYFRVRRNITCKERPPVESNQVRYFKTLTVSSRVAQWKRAGPITQRSEDQNLALLNVFSFFFSF